MHGWPCWEINNKHSGAQIMKKIVVLAAIFSCFLGASEKVNHTLHRRSSSLPLSKGMVAMSAEVGREYKLIEQEVISKQPSREPDKPDDKKEVYDYADCEKDCRRMCCIVCILCMAVDCPCPVSCLVAGFSSAALSYHRLKTEQ